MNFKNNFSSSLNGNKYHRNILLGDSNAKVGCVVVDDVVVVVVVVVAAVDDVDVEEGSEDYSRGH
jgi:molybdopterin-binding protein